MTLGKIVKDLLQSQLVFTYSKSTMKTLGKSCVVFIVNLEQISHILAFPLLTLNKQRSAGMDQNTFKLVHNNGIKIVFDICSVLTVKVTLIVFHVY